MMNVYVFVFLVVLQLLNSVTTEARKDYLCMGPDESVPITTVLCKKERNNNVLWQKVVDCHNQIEEKFMRRSNQAVCARHDDYPVGTNETVSLHRVFRNICGFLEGSADHLKQATECHHRLHAQEQLFVLKKYGEDVPCNIAKCIRDLNIWTKKV